MKAFTATLAVLLLAGASTAAMAQDRDHGADTQIRPAQPAPHAPPQPAAPHAGFEAPQGGHARFGAPPPSGAAPQPAPPVARGAPTPGQTFQHHDGQSHDWQGQRVQGQPPVNAAPGGQNVDRGGQPGPGAGRQFDHERGPREVIPPAADHGQFAGRDRHWDGRRDDHRDGDHRDGGHWDADHHWDGDHREANRGNNPWGGHGQHWQPGHAPPVFWSQDRYRIGSYRAPYGYYARAWGFGDFLPRGWYAEDYWLGDFLDYDLPYPPPGYEWVRVGGDALMIDRYTGRIVQVVRGIFW